MVMGVLNVTPDSFSDGGHHFDPSSALDRALAMIDLGADVVDIGGESTRPGAAPVDPLVEQGRVIPVIEALKARLGDSEVRISIDTRHESTAVAAVRAGASLINDVGATLWPTAAELGVGWVAMHMFGDPRTMQIEPHYDDVVNDVRSFLVERALRASRAGVEEVWVDPGIGFGKTTAHNVELLANLDRLVDEGFPVLVGTSRKRFLGELTARSDSLRGRPLLPSPNGSSPHPGGRDVARSGPVEPGPLQPSAVDDRLEGSLATAVWSIIKGAEMVRVHDVDATVQAIAVISGSIPNH